MHHYRNDPCADDDRPRPKPDKPKPAIHITAIIEDGEIIECHSDTPNVQLTYVDMDDLGRAFGSELGDDEEYKDMTLALPHDVKVTYS